MAETLFEDLDRGATLSDDGQYRYDLWRRWGPGPALGALMLNPSTADADKDDATIRTLMKFARREGCDGIKVRNLFAWRTSKPHFLRNAYAEGLDIVGELNDWWIEDLFTDRFGVRPILAAWGRVDWMFTAARANTVLGRFAPRLSVLDPTPYRGPTPHPLYLKDDTPIIRGPANPPIVRGPKRRV